MSGSGTSKAAADRFHVRSLLYDLNPAPAFGRGGWDALRDDVDDSADLIFFHPPYHSMVTYSGSVWGRALIRMTFPAAQVMTNFWTS